MKIELDASKHLPSTLSKEDIKMIEIGFLLDAIKERASLINADLSLIHKKNKIILTIHTNEEPD